VAGAYGFAGLGDGEHGSGAYRLAVPRSYQPARPGWIASEPSAPAAAGDARVTRHQWTWPKPGSLELVLGGVDEQLARPQEFGCKEGR